MAYGAAVGLCAATKRLIGQALPDFAVGFDCGTHPV
jgi:hypothetical protein